MLTLDVGTREAALAFIDALAHPRADRLAGQHPDARRPPGDHLASPAGRGGAGRGGDLGGPAARQRRPGGRGGSRRRLRRRAGRGALGGPCVAPSHRSRSAGAGLPTWADPVSRFGLTVWRTLSDVRFAVVQIIVLAVAGLIGTMVRQIPAFALHGNPAAYATEMADLHRRYDPVSILGANVGPTMVDVFEGLGFFRIFTAPWFTALLTMLIVSIVVCTIDRTPRLWRGVRIVHVEQPAPFFDLRLGERAAFADVEVPDDALASVLRRRRFKVQTATDDEAAFTLRRPEPVLQDGHAADPPRAHPLPHRRGRDRGLRLRDGDLRRRGAVRARAAGRDARQPAGQEPRLRGAHGVPTVRSPTSGPTWPSTATGSRSRARRSASTTR